MTSLSPRLATTNLLARLIEEPDLPVLVRELPGDRFTALVREVGVADADELVALATTEQLVAAFDEDLFVNARPGEREVFDRRRFVTWLEVLLEAGDEAVARRMDELSEEFVAHALSSVVLVFDHDTLRERIAYEEDGDEADKALERTLNEEIDGYLLVARQEEGWDAVLALVLALDRRHRALLVRILDRCVALASDYVDDLEALTDVLSNAESLAEDVEAAREERRSRLGFVDPRAARGFLELSKRPLHGPAGSADRDAHTRGYFRELDRAAPSRSKPAPRAAGDRLGRAIAALAAPTPAGEREPAPVLTRALSALGESEPTRFAERLRELAYLSNVVLAGATPEDGGRYAAGEAAEIALATVALGAELHAREIRSTAGSHSGRASPEELRAVLEACPADLLFRRGAATMAARHPDRRDGLVRGRRELDEVTTGLAPRVLILGNSGSGKSTRARALGEAHGIAVLDLDSITWAQPGVRRDLEESARALEAFLAAHDGWVIEGCYASLVERALPTCTELVFLDPGVEACLANNRRRDWEPHKYPSKETQDANLEFLQQWVREYYTRDDEYSHRAHLAVYAGFGGKKTHITSAGPG
jgi:adenylate kinase family enzyme